MKTSAATVSALYLAIDAAVGSPRRQRRAAIDAVHARVLALPAGAERSALCRAVDDAGESLDDGSGCY